MTGLSVRFGTRTVLDDLSLTIERGELLTVLRPQRLWQDHVCLRFIAGFIEADGLAGTLDGGGAWTSRTCRRFSANLGCCFQS